MAGAAAASHPLFTPLAAEDGAGAAVGGTSRQTGNGGFCCEATDTETDDDGDDVGDDDADAADGAAAAADATDDEDGEDAAAVRQVPVALHFLR